MRRVVCVPVFWLRTRPRWRNPSSYFAHVKCGRIARRTEGATRGKRWATMLPSEFTGYRSASISRGLR